MVPDNVDVAPGAYFVEIQTSSNEALTFLLPAAIVNPTGLEILPEK